MRNGVSIIMFVIAGFFLYAPSLVAFFNISAVAMWGIVVVATIPAVGANNEMKGRSNWE